MKATVAGVIARKRLIRRWPFLFASLCFETARSWRLWWLAHGHHLTAYKRLFWGTQTIVAILAACILCDVFRNLPGYKELPSSFRRASFACAVAIGVFVATASIYDANVAHSAPWAVTELNIQRCVTAGWLGCVLALVCRPSVVGMGWTADVLAIGCGQVLLASAGALSSYAEAHVPWREASIHHIETSITIATAAAWAITLSGHKIRVPAIPRFKFLPASWYQTEEKELV